MSIMPKVKQVHTILAYDETNKEFGSYLVRTWTFEEALQEYIGMCQLLGQGEFSNVHRLDFVGGNHVLFMFVDTRTILNQNNVSFKIKEL